MKTVKQHKRVDISFHLRSYNLFDDTLVDSIPLDIDFPDIVGPFNIEQYIQEYYEVETPQQISLLEELTQEKIDTNRFLYFLEIDIM